MAFPPRPPHRRICPPHPPLHRLSAITEREQRKHYKIIPHSAHGCAEWGIVFLLLLLSAKLQRVESIGKCNKLRHSAPEKSSTFSANFSTFVSHPKVSHSPCSIANETSPQFTTFGYSSGTKSRKRRKNAPHACQKGLCIYPKMGIALSRESL